MDSQIKIVANILILSLLISMCSGLQGHRKLTAFEDDHQVASYSGNEDVHEIIPDEVIRRLIEVDAVLDYENPGSNTRHQPGKGKRPRPRI
ncbi:unnamed protein product [Rhodiola kirilowii]